MKLRESRAAIPIVLLIAASLVLAACNFPGSQPTPEGDSVATSAAQTVAAELTQSAAEATEAPPTATDPAASATPEASDTPAGPTTTPTSSTCTDRASFVSDVTVPDDTLMEPGESFTKTWRLRNSGTCTWKTQYDLVFDSGRAMGAPASIPLPGNVPPNSTVDLSVDMTAPSTDGTFRGNWLLRNEDGETFGIGSDASTAFWVQIQVGPTPTPEPEVYNLGKFDLKQTFSMDLDEITGVSHSSPDNDLFFEAETATDKFLTPQNGAQIKLMGGSVPSHADCESASLSTTRVDLDTFAEGDFFCFETNEGRLGIMQIENITGGSSQTITVDVRTWEK